MYEKEGTSKNPSREQQGGVERRGGGTTGGSTSGESRGTGGGGFQQTRTSGQQAGQQEKQARFYVDNQPVHGISETRATVREIVQRAGKNPDDVEVFRLENRNDSGGERVTLEEEISISGNEVCYLRTEAREGTQERGLGVSDIGSSENREESGSETTSGERGSVSTTSGGSQTRESERGFNPRSERR